MTSHDFEKLVSKIGLSPVPEKFRSLIQNVAFLIEDDVSEETRKELGLPDSETLLGLYTGVPHTERTDAYGIGGTLPGTLTLYREPILQATREEGISVQKMIKDTIWHEIAHHFGLDEHQVQRAERRHI